MRPTSLLLPVLASLALLACEPMEPSSNPLTPVVVTATAAGPVATVSDPRFDSFDEPQVIRSEDLSSMGQDTVEAGEPVADAAPAVAVEPPPAPEAAVAVAAPAIAPVAATNTTTMPVVNPKAALGWAVRLVSTIPNAQPPRAILGLPDGREVVVTPGSMVPDAGLVVLSIGPQAVQLARVKANGDHAIVDAFDLTPQY